MFKARKRRQKANPTAELTPDQYQDKVKQAEELVAKGDLQQALTLLEEALGAAPNHVRTRS